MVVAGGYIVKCFEILPRRCLKTCRSVNMLPVRMRAYANVADSLFCDCLSAVSPSSPSGHLASRPVGELGSRHHSRAFPALEVMTSDFSYWSLLVACCSLSL